MPYINSLRGQAGLTTIAARTKQGCCLMLNTCGKTIRLVIFCLEKTIKAPLLLNKFFAKKVVVENSPIQEETIVSAFEGLNPLMQSYSVTFNKKPLKLYKEYVGKAGDLAEKITPSSDMPFLVQRDLWSRLVSVAVEKKPKAFLHLLSKKEKEELKNKLKDLSTCLQALNISVPKEFTDLSAIDQVVKQLENVYESVHEHVGKHKTKSLAEVILKANYLILGLQDYLQKYKQLIDQPIDEESKKIARDILKGHPLLAKLAPLTLTSGGAALSAFLIDQQGLLPADWNPNSSVSNAIVGTIGLLFTQIILAGDLLVSQENAVIISQNATMAPETCGLSSFNYSDGEVQNIYLEYIISSLVNQMFMFSFAYAGACLCGSKEKVKDFVEHRISSTIAYKTCNATLDYLGIPFWPNKSISLITSSIINPLISFFS